MNDPEREWYGVELMDAVDLKSGTAYPILHRLQADGWLTSDVEDTDPSAAGRPRRRFYKLTGLGQREAATLAARGDTVTPHRRRPSIRPGEVPA
ncbi:MAG: helix-turn-helix transcriptional regulator [Actinobacteria bacterium]|nr:helix-turn-helix transcriptional regulator [Actinomycetota bacterium]